MRPQKDHPEGLQNPKPGHGLKKLVLSSNLHFLTISLEGAMVDLRALGTGDLYPVFFYFAISNSTQLYPFHTISNHPVRPPSPTTPPHR